MKEMHCTCIRGAFVAFWELWISEIRRTVCFLSPSASSWAHVFGVCRASASRLRTPCLCVPVLVSFQCLLLRLSLVESTGNVLPCHIWSRVLLSGCLKFWPELCIVSPSVTISPLCPCPLEMQTGCCRLRSSAWLFEVLNGGPDLSWSSMIQIL